MMTGTANDTWFVTAEYRGEIVRLHDGDQPNCRHPEIEVMHHFGADGKHYCPTMFIWCMGCFAIGNEPEPFSCQKWGEL